MILFCGGNKRSQARGGVAKLAENASLNREHLYRMLSENGNPELRSLEALLDALARLVDSLNTEAVLSPSVK